MQIFPEALDIVGKMLADIGKFGGDMLDVPDKEEDDRDDQQGEKQSADQRRHHGVATFSLQPTADRHKYEGKHPGDGQRHQDGFCKVEDGC